MKYHSTKTTVLTMFVVVISLLVVSLFAIVYLNSKTPIEAITEAIVQNLEIPDGYSLEINNINKSFLKKQNIESVEIKKEDKMLLKLEEVRIGLSFFDYLKILFNKKSDINISIGNVDLFYNSDFLGFFSSLGNIKIKDNTFSIQKSAEKEVEKESKPIDFNEFLSMIKNEDLYDLSLILGEKITGNSIHLAINKGSMIYDVNDLQISASLKKSNLYITKTGVLETLDFNFSDIKVNQASTDLQIDKINVGLDKSQLDVLLSEISVIQGLDKITVNDIALKHNLSEITNVKLLIGELSGNIKGYNIDFDSDEVNLDFKASDIKATNELRNLKVDKFNYSLSAPLVNLDLYFIDKKLSADVILGKNNYLKYEGYQIDLDDFSLNVESPSILPNSIIAKIGSLNFNYDNNNFSLDNVTMQVDALLNTSTVYYDNEFKISNFTTSKIDSSYDSIHLKLGLGVLTKIKNFDDNITSDVLVDFSLNNKNKILDGFANLDNIKFGSNKDEATVAIKYNGPLNVLDKTEKHSLININYNALTAELDAKWVDDFKKSSVDAKIDLNDVNLYQISKMFSLNDKYPFLANYIVENTSLKGYFDGSFAYKEGQFVPFDATLNSKLTIDQIKLGTSSIDLDFSLDSILNNSKVTVSKLFLSALNYKAEIAGSYDIENDTPEGSLKVGSSDDSKTFVIAKVSKNKENKITLYTTSPLIDQFSMSSLVDYSIPSVIIVDALFDYKNETFPLNIIADTKQFTVDATSIKGINFNLDYENNIKAKLVLDDLFVSFIDNSIFSGSSNFVMDSDGKWDLNINDFVMQYNKGALEIGFSSSIENNKFDIKNAYFENNTVEGIQTRYSGYLDFEKLDKGSLTYTPFNLKFSFGDNKDQSIDFSSTNSNGLQTYFIDISKFNISPLVQNSDDLSLNCRLVGSTDFNGSNDFVGRVSFADKPIAQVKKVQVTKANENTNNFLRRAVSLIPFISLPDLEDISTTENLVSLVSNISFESGLEIKDNLYELKNVNFNSKAFSLNDGLISFDSKDMKVSLNSNINIIKHTKNTNQENTFDLDFNIGFKSVIDSIKNRYFVNKSDVSSKINYKEIGSTISQIIKEKSFDDSLLNGIEGSLSITNIKAFVDTDYFEKLWPDTYEDEPKFTEINCTYGLENSRVDITGDNLNGYLDLSKKEANIVLDKKFGVGLSAFLDFKDQFNINIDSVYIPANVVSKAMYMNTLKFYGGAMTGQLNVVDLFGKAKYYGSLNVDRLKFKTFWSADTEISINNATILAFDDQLYASNVDAYCVDEDGSLNKIIGNLQLNLDGLKFIDLKIDLNILDQVPFHVPILSQNIDLRGKASNHLILDTDGKYSVISGDLVLSDTIIKGKIEDTPDWIHDSPDKTVDLKITTGKNVTFYYPDQNSPIIKANVAQDQNLAFYFSGKTGEKKASGSVDISQGEIFYFQKNFFISGGTLKLDSNDSTNELEILVSLQATLKELDSSKNSVDIVLTLNNSPINNLYPIFSSIPSKPTKEIMEILGQSFTGSTGSSSSSSVAGIATAATSVFSSLGYINSGDTGSLNQSIAKILNLDIFSLNSSIVENLLLDTFITNPELSNYSPLAKYLNNTTLYMGKYVNDTSYFQIMLNLIAKDDIDKTSFLASDLSLDLEMSYEMNTPIGKISFFTKPQQLSILDILDTIGFSVTKTIQLR